MLLFRFPKSFCITIIGGSFVRLFSTCRSAQLSKPKVFVTRSDLPEQALEILERKCTVLSWSKPSPVPRDYLLSNVKDCAGIYCFLTDKIDGQVFSAAGIGLKVIATMSAGYDHIDLKSAKAAGVKIGTTPDLLTEATAELTVAILLAASRRLFQANQEIRNGGWSKCVWGPLYMCGQGLHGSTVGIFGLGSIGTSVMEKILAFKPGQVIYCGRGPKPNVTKAKFQDFDTIMSTSDFVIVTCALTDQTRGLFNARAFSLMKPNAVFVNASRGAVVNQEDLLAVLKSRKIFAAALDVMTPEPLHPDHELTKLDNCLLLPHIGSATYQARIRSAEFTAYNILAGLEGVRLPGELNLK